MELPAKLYNEIVNFLSSLPDIHDNKTRQALILSAGLDPQLKNQISFEGASSQFIPKLLTTFNEYGTLEDGQHPIEAVLTVAKNYVGIDKKVYCENLVQQLRLANFQPDSQRFSQQKDINNNALHHSIGKTTKAMDRSGKCVKQTSKGEKSPNVITTGDITITYGS